LVFFRPGGILKRLGRGHTANVQQVELPHRFL